MKFLKGFGKFLLVILSIILSVLIIAVTITYEVRDISSKYINEKTFIEIISNINIEKFLKEPNGEDIKEIKEIKEKLAEYNIPPEIIDEFLESEPVKKMTGVAIDTTIDYILYDKEIPSISFNEDEIISYIDTTISFTIDKLKENNIKYIEITDERKNEILNTLKEQIPIIQNEIQKIQMEIIEEIKNSDEYEKIEEYKKELNNIISVINYIYSSHVTTIFIIVLIVLYILLAVSRLSFYKYLKIFGIINLIVAIMLYFASIATNELFKYLDIIPYAFKSIAEAILNNSKTLLINKSIIFLIIGLILIILNIVIYYILEKRENKKIDL